jgi:hypothetical protein
MRLSFAIMLVIHGLIHLLGFAKAFNLAELPQLTRPIAAPIGVTWLVAALLFLLTAGALFVWPRWWWATGVVAVAVSMAVIIPSWTDAKFGALANVIVLAGVVVGFGVHGPFGLRAAYEQEVSLPLGSAALGVVVTDADVAHLPVLVQRYLRTSGVIGQPRVHNFRVRLHGRIRQGPDSRWMPFTAEQHNSIPNPTRLFYMDASMRLVPFQVLHRYVGDSATMRVRIGGLIPVVNMAGPEMTRAETVTLFNDMCIMAPATLVDPAITWDGIDGQTVRATFTNAGHTIHATLVFNEAGELTDFWSDDRLRASADGETLEAVRWSTPVGRYRTFGSVRLASSGEGRWHDESGAYAYLELELDEVQYNVPAR